MAEPDYADFLKRTGAGEAEPDFAAFLKRTGAVAAPEAPVDTHWSDGGGNEYAITGDPQQFNNAKGPEIALPLANIFSAAGQGAKQGLQSGMFPEQPGLVDAELETLRSGNPLARAGAGIGLAGSGINRLAGAALGGVGGAITGAGEELPAWMNGRQLARDVNAIPEAFGGSPGMFHTPGEVPPVAFKPRTAAEGNLLANFPRPTDLPATNLLAAPPDMAAMTVRPGDPVPQSVGAAASRDMSPPSVIDMTPKQVEAYRSTAEGQKLLESQQPGQADRNAYVPGVAASTAEVEQTVNAAREAKAANIAHPEVSQASRDQAAANNDARQQFQQSTFKSPVDINNATEARAAQAETDLAATWKNKAPADAQPVIDAADAIKASPDGRRPVVRSAIDAVTNELFDKDGKLLTDPEQLYGVRKHIDDLLSKEAGATDPKSIRAAANLQQLKTTLDGVIEDAAPGFKQYLKNFSEASRPIDEMRVLQGHESKLYDTQGRMQLSRVQTMMRNIVDSRAAPGINPYKSISDETMQRLWALRDDLRRSASAQELARTPGSDTAQTAFDLAKRGAAIGGRLVAHGVANHYFPVLGSLGLRAAEGAIENRRAVGAQRAGIAKGLGNLNPNLLRPQPD